MVQNWRRIIVCTEANDRDWRQAYSLAYNERILLERIGNAKDAGYAFRLLGEKNISGVYCVGSGTGKPLKSYVEIIHQFNAI